MNRFTFTMVYVAVLCGFGLFLASSVLSIAPLQLIVNLMRMI